MPLVLIISLMQSTSSFKIFLQMKEGFGIAFVKILKHHSNLLGYELMNEPWLGNIFTGPWRVFTSENTLLLSLYKDLHQKIREVDKEKILFFGKLVSS